MLSARFRLPVAALALALPVRAEDWAVLLSFTGPGLPPNSVCDGQAEVQDGELRSLTPVLFEPGEKIDGKRWSCRTWGTKDASGGRSRTFSVRRPKGIILRIDGTANSRIVLDTRLGTSGTALAETAPSGVTVLDGKATLQRIPAHTRLSGPETEDDYPGIAVGRDGTVWVAWQSWDGEKDRVLCRRFSRGAWSEPEEIPSRTGDVYRVMLAADNDGGLWAVWAENSGRNWDLWASKRESSWGGRIRLTSDPGADFNHVLGILPGGDPVVVWQAERDGQYDVYKARLTDRGLTEVVNVSRTAGNDWEPAVAVAADGTVAVVWDTYEFGSFDILAQLYPPGGSGGNRIVVSATAAFEAHASAVFGPRGRLWVAWDDGGPNWGKHGRPAPLIHAQRRVKLACIETDGRVMTPATGLNTCLGEELKGIWELPRITVDATGHPVVLFRQLSDIARWRGRKKVQREHQSRGVWAYAVTRFDGTAWSRPQLLPGSEGRNDQRVRLAWAPGGGLWAACAGDARVLRRAEVPVNNNVSAAAIPLARDGTGIELVEAPWRRVPEDLREAKRTPYTTTVGGKEYRVVFGDTHRHTDISRCGMNRDGSLRDTYRYGIDAVRLDFLGISDHDQDILKHRYDRERRPLQNYMWWRSEKFCDLYHMPETFIPLYGYEHGGSHKKRGGHKNIMYSKRGNPCIEEDAPADLFKALKGRKAVAIPHQLADGGSATDWDKWDGEWETVAEIFQARGSYEFLGTPRLARVQRQGFFFWDALAKGVQIGVIASSDHGLTHSAYACVYVEQRTRDGILDGLRAKRTYGATDTIILDFRMGEHFMGETITIRERPVLTANIIGTGELTRVDVVRNGQFIYTVDPDGKDYAFTFADADLDVGAEAYYYLRCVQANNELAWSSPIWVKRE